MTQEKKESIVLSLETNPKQKAARLFNKRMRLLLQSGLIAGIIPTSMQKKSNQLILDTVLKKLGGRNAE